LEENLQSSRNAQKRYERQFHKTNKELEARAIGVFNIGKGARGSKTVTADKFLPAFLYAAK
jgi:hypothetical protein